MNIARILSHAACLAWGLVPPAQASEPVMLAGSDPYAPFAVVELFTSEGCSSCPPADRLLSGLAGEADREGKGIFALSFHVDYWNYLGWSDPFSRPGFTERQQRYAQALGSGVYTPQMVVNGAAECVGSREDQARKAVAAALRLPAPVAIALYPRAESGGVLRIRYRVTGQGEGDLLNLALLEKGLSVPVKRGENRGRNLKHENVVRAFRTVRLDAGGSGEATLDIGSEVHRDKASLIAYAQGAESLRVLGAARAGLPPPGPPPEPPREPH